MDYGLWMTHDTDDTFHPFILYFLFSASFVSSSFEKGLSVFVSSLFHHHYLFIQAQAQLRSVDQFIPRDAIDDFESKRNERQRVIIT
jgi:hypothetical protein